MKMPQDYIRPEIKSTTKDALRRKSKQKFPCPNTLEDLRVLVEAQDPQPVCSYDQCDPRLYKSHLNCMIHPHSHLELMLDGAKNQFGNQCFKPLKMNIAFRSEAMELTRVAVQYFDRPQESLNNIQLASLKSLQTWIRDHMSLLFPDTHPTSPPSLETTLFESLMRTLWTYMNVLFFGSDIPHGLSCFCWSSSPSLRYKTAVGLASRGFFRVKIAMVPYMDCVTMLGVSMHEICHVFFIYHTCLMCFSTAWNLNTVGHGRAWQVLASAVERKFTEFTGLSTDLGRFDSLRSYWNRCWPLPSMHDLVDWQLDRQTMLQVYKRDLNMAVRTYVGQGGQVEEFPLRGFSEYWWVDTQQVEQIARERSLGDGIASIEGSTFVCHAEMNCGGVEVEQEGSGEDGQDKKDLEEL